MQSLSLINTVGISSFYLLVHIAGLPKCVCVCVCVCGGGGGDIETDKQVNAVAGQVGARIQK